MHAYYTIFLLAFLILLGVFLIRYVDKTVDNDFRSLARSANDGEYRLAEIKRLDSLLADRLPLPEAVHPLKPPASGTKTAAPIILSVLGVVFLWGAGSVREGRETWLYGGLAALLSSTLIMLVSLRRRKWAHLGKLLLYRANLRRLDNDRAAAAADLRELLRLTPWDDSAWAELADDLAADGRLPEALQAIEAAVRLDPRYDEYRMLEASLAIRTGRMEEAREAIERWILTCEVPADDPRAAIYRAALELAQGRREQAAELLKGALLDREKADIEFLDTDQALAGVKELLPGRISQ